MVAIELLVFPMLVAVAEKCFEFLQSLSDFMEQS